MSRKARLWLLTSTILAAALVLLALPPLPQSQAYHNFADKRNFFGIPNFFDVISNMAFLLVAVPGLILLFRKQAPDAAQRFLERSERLPYFIFFLAVGATFVGSSYYHLKPENERLVWDGLPMSLGFMSLVAATIAERISIRAGLRLLLPLLVLGVGSVIHWRWTELRGHGDLRLYIFVQFGSLLAIVLLLMLFPPRYTRGSDLLLALGIYGLAKIAELLDPAIFSVGGIVSGHTIKHLLAAAATFCVLRMLELRTPLIAQA